MIKCYPFPINENVLGIRCEFPTRIWPSAAPSGSRKRPSKIANDNDRSSRNFRFVPFFHVAGAAHLLLSWFNSSSIAEPSPGDVFWTLFVRDRLFRIKVGQTNENRYVLRDECLQSKGKSPLSNKNVKLREVEIMYD